MVGRLLFPKKRRNRKRQGDGGCICCKKPYEGRPKAALECPIEVEFMNAPDNMGLFELVCHLQARGPVGTDSNPYPRLAPAEAKQTASLAKARAREAARCQDPHERKCCESHMALFEIDEIETGELLGIGGFSHVYEIQSFHPLRQKPKHHSSSRSSSSKPVVYTKQQKQARDFLAQHAQRKVPPPSSSVHQKEGFQSQMSLLQQLSLVSAVTEDGEEEEREESSEDLHTLTTSNSAQLSVMSPLEREGEEEEDGNENENDNIQGEEAPDQLEKTVSRYALKHLRPGLIQVPGKFAKAAMDISCEAEMMMCLDHPNIVKIRGHTTGGPGRFKHGAHDSYFLIIDRLTETLEDRIFEWRKRHKALQKKQRKGRPAAKAVTKLAKKLLPLKKRDSSSGDESPFVENYRHYQDPEGVLKIDFAKEEDKLLLEKLRVAHDISAALEYLHDRRIVYRDLKSSNLGFDIRGDVKLFDFGLARYLPTSTENIEEAFRMSNVGTRRYSAPEIERKQPYNLKADVYSMGVVMWEMLSMCATRYAKRDEAKRITHYPACPCWPQELQDLVSSMLSEDPTQRPTIKFVRSRIQQILVNISTASADEESSIDLQQFLGSGAQNRRRSTFRLEFLSVAAEEFKDLDGDGISATSASTSFSAL